MPQINYQSWLDRVARTFFDDDFAGYAAAISLPLTVITRTATLIVSDAGELRKGFDAWRDMLRDQKATHLVRTARGVETLADGLISGVYTTYILRNADPVVPPFDSSMILRQERDAWRCVIVTSGMSNPRWPMALPQVPAPEPEAE